MKYAVLIAAFVLMGSATGWAGQEVFGPVAMLLCVVLGLSTAALFAYRRQQADPAARPWLMVLVWGVMLALGLYFAGTTLWMANDVLLSSDLYLGAERLVQKTLLGVGLGLLLGLTVAAHVRQPKRRWARWLRSLLFTVYLGVLLTGFVLYLAKTGVREPEKYPPREESPYLLPWPGGVTWTCTQGNWGVLTHRKHDVYHFDFPMPIGSPVCASRDGVVESVIDEHDGNKNPLLGGDVGDVPGNGIFIRHADGTVAVYWHIRQKSSRVHKGQKVKQGDIIAESGNVGFSTSPHLHFGLHDAMWNSQPITFRDVDIRGGIPRAGLRYTSGNRPLERP